MYIIRKENKRGQRAGYVKCEGQPWEAATFITYKAADKVARWMQSQHRDLIFIVDLQDACDCADDLMIHA